ncbi:hypothetical protein JCM5296_000264 [Sporobolomyces johnsonii]
MSHLQSSRPRPQPLSLDPNPHHHQHASSHSGPTTGAPSDRARFLSSLRSAPIPHTQHSYQQQPQPMASPQAAALAQFQQAQTVYLAELQRQIMIQQNQILLNQQQIEAEAALRAMQVQQQQMDLEREREREREEQQAARANPLVASALARRKRQSLNFEAQQRESLPAALQQQQPPVRQRVSTPPSSASPSASSTRSTPPPPAVILSAPGEPYPDTSSASGSESGGTRPSSPASTSEAKSSPKSPANTNDAELRAARRRSHLDTLSSALGSRQKRRPASIGGVSDLSTPRPSTLTFPHAPSPRSVSDSHASLRSPSFAPPPPGPVLSPFASSFTPTPVSSSVPHEPAYVSSRPPAVPGTATAVRQPRGPPVSVQEKNFGARIRQKAIENLAMRSRARGSAVHEHAHEIGVAC